MFHPVIAVTAYDILISNERGLLLSVVQGGIIGGGRGAYLISYLSISDTIGLL